MSILRNLVNAIVAALGVTPARREDIDASLDRLADQQPEHLDWRHSIVDLMKLTGQDSSLAARKDLAEELGYTGALDGSAEMNLWLHAQVMHRIASYLVVSTGAFR